MALVGPVASNALAGALLQPGQEPDSSDVLTVKGDEDVRSEGAKSGHIKSEEHLNGTEEKAEVGEEMTHEEGDGVERAVEEESQEPSQQTANGGEVKERRTDEGGNSAKGETEGGEGEGEVDEPAEDVVEVVPEAEGTVVEESTSRGLESSTEEDAKEITIGVANESAAGLVINNATEGAKAGATQDSKEATTADINEDTREDPKDGSTEDAFSNEWLSNPTTAFDAFLPLPDTPEFMMADISSNERASMPIPAMTVIDYLTEPVSIPMDAIDYHAFYKEDAKAFYGEVVKAFDGEFEKESTIEDANESTMENVNESTQDHANDISRRNGDESAKSDTKEHANGDSKATLQPDAEGHVSNEESVVAQDNTEYTMEENGKRLAKKEEAQEDANEGTKEVHDASEHNAKGDAEVTREATSGDSEPVGVENGTQAADKVIAAGDQAHAREEHQNLRHDETKEEEVQEIEGKPKNEASSSTEAEGKDIIEEDLDKNAETIMRENIRMLRELTVVEASHEIEENTKKKTEVNTKKKTEVNTKKKTEENTKKKTEENTKKKETDWSSYLDWPARDGSNAIATAVTKATQRVQGEVTQISAPRVDRYNAYPPPPSSSWRYRGPVNPERSYINPARESTGRTAIDHHSYYRERNVWDEVHVVDSLLDRERVYRRHDREREREQREEERERDERRQGRRERERDRERDEERERERRRLRREREKEWELGLDSPQGANPLVAQVKSSSTTYHLPHILRVTKPLESGNLTSESQREQEKSTTDLRSSTITVPPQSASASTSTLGVLGPKQYHYHPLKEMEFRLVKVLPERMSVLKTELLHQSLDDSLDYIAISYAWGDSMDTEELFLDGAKVPVATSLYYALTAVRRKKSEVLVWVDALCIDQQNADERATQVRLMGHIYSKATSVAVWLGPEADESELAMDLLQDVSDDQVSPARERATQERIRSTTKYPESAALFALFKREYWKRLWCIQEVLLAKQTMVYCGDAVYPWDIYKKAAQAFWGSDSDPHVRQGPSSFPDKDALMQLGDASLLEVMRTCRKQLSENPRDKVFGILGLLPVATQREFPVDYSQSVKTVYTDVVDYLISTTDQLDVIRESIHFPIHVSNAGLPTWCPDWSYIPQVSGLSRNLGFDASKGTRARYKFHDKRRKLEIVGIKLDVIKFTGVAVGTFCSSQDYLTAFLHWRAIMLHGLNDEAKKLSHPLHKIFCRTLCLGQVPEDHVLRGDWHEVCYHVFAYLTKTKFPQLALDSDLLNCASATGLIEPDARRKFLQVHFGNRMMGRSFCITEHGLMGMGSGYMTTEDLVVVPFGCCTPIILRPEGRRNEYRYIGDIYVDGYMHGEAIEEWEAGRGSNEAKYILC